MQVREVKIKDILFHSVLSPMLLAALWILTPLVFVKLTNIPAIFFYLAAVLLTYYPLKWSVIGAVLVYKAVAPMSVRSRCRFIPTCSTYMIMAIYKFGLFVGVVKGIKRIYRCKPPNGGEDYP